MKSVRKIVHIDEDKCNGCGLCVPACHEGAIHIVDGKARLASDILCDGLGDCLGECPQGAITIEEREAEAYDADAVKARLAAHSSRATDVAQGGCPSARAWSRESAASAVAGSSEASASQLLNWPVQLHLVPPAAPYLRGARLLICADCVPFACADFHRDLLAGHVVVTGCPKLDDGQLYIDKLAVLIAQNDLESIDIAFMEVPCCHGLVHIVRHAALQSGKEVPIQLTRVGIQGGLDHPEI